MGFECPEPTGGIPCGNYRPRAAMFNGVVVCVCLHVWQCHGLKEEPR